jgi:hypothetical protein
MIDTGKANIFIGQETELFQALLGREAPLGNLGQQGF